MFAARTRTPPLKTAPGRSILAGMDERTSRGVLVLGMHRSGTSAATRVLSLLGLHANRADDEIPVDHKNPKGYWESRSLVAFNDELLALLGADAWSVPALEPGWEDDPRLDALHAAAPAAFAHAFPGDGWVWKDPRACVLAPFWRRALGPPAGVVLALRHPLEVADSLDRRDSYSLAHSLALWERYTRAAAAAAEGLPVLVADYADLMDDPLAWCDEAAAFLLGRGFDAGYDGAAVVAFLDRGLRHSSRSAAELGEGSGVSAEQQAIYATLRAARGRHERWSPPALPPETAWVEPLLAARRRRAPGPFAVLVQAQELVRTPHLVSGFERHVGGDAAMVVYAESDTVAPDVARALALAGVGDEVDVTLLAPPPGSEPQVAASVDAMLAAAPPPPAFAALPRLARRVPI